MPGSVQPKSKSAWEVLHVARFRWFITAFFLDSAADMLWLVTLGWVAQQAGSGGVQGLVLFASGVPAVLLMLVGGGLADKWGPGRVVVATMAARVVTMAAWALVAASSVTPITVIWAAAIALGAIEGYHRPSVETYPTELLPPDGQAAAKSVERVGTRVAQALGPTGGGFLMAAFGVGAPCAVAVLALVVGLAIFRRLRPLPGTRPDGAHSSMGGEERSVISHARGGVGVVRRDEVLRPVIPIHSAYNALTAGVTLAGFPIAAAERGLSAAGFGLAYGAWGIGLLVGSVLALVGVHHVNHVVRASMVLIAAVGATLIGVGLASSFTTLVVLAGVAGAISGPVGPLLGGFERARAGTGKHTGSIMAVVSVGLEGAEPAGFLAVALLVATLGFGPAVVLVGAVVAVMSLTALLRPAVRRE